jgi:hypothetical protein
MGQLLDLRVRILHSDASVGPKRYCLTFGCGWCEAEHGNPSYTYFSVFRLFPTSRN